MRTLSSCAMKFKGFYIIVTFTKNLIPLDVTQSYLLQKIVPLYQEFLSEIF